MSLADQQKETEEMVKRLPALQGLAERHDMQRAGEAEANADEVRAFLWDVDQLRQRLLADGSLSSNGHFTPDAEVRLRADGVAEETLTHVAEAQRLETDLDHWCNDLIEEKRMDENGVISKEAMAELRQGNFSVALIAKIQAHQRRAALGERRSALEQVYRDLPPTTESNLDPTREVDMSKREK